MASQVTKVSHRLFNGNMRLWSGLWKFCRLPWRVFIALPTLLVKEVKSSIKTRRKETIPCTRKHSNYSLIDRMSTLSNRWS